MSAILSADDLNDFISPGVACIKPVETLPKEDGLNPYEVTTEDKVHAKNPTPASITLTDCLACSGCVTSAEAVLVSLQSHTEVLNTLDNHPSIEVLDAAGDRGHPTDAKLFIASVSPQARASLAATFDISEKHAGFMIEQFLSGSQGLRIGGNHGSHFQYVVDTNRVRDACLVLGADEVRNSANSRSTTRPILTSACPGWICYAEKTHPHVLPHLSKLKSPQALSGTLLKSALSKILHLHPSQIWHLAIMPCFDKKLEASREELTDRWWSSSDDRTSASPVRDVDCVITSRELLSLADSRGIQLASLPLRPLTKSERPPFPDQRISEFLYPKPRPGQRSSLRQQVEAGTSGGYLYHILKTQQAHHPGSTISMQRGRNADVIEYTLKSPDNTPLFRCARYYGFRNIQNLVRKLKPARPSKLPGAITKRPTSAIPTATTEYGYVEVMACPGGCTNGGGQIKVEDVSSALPPPQMPVNQKLDAHSQRQWLARVDEAYYSAGSSSDSDDHRDPDLEMSTTEEDVGEEDMTINGISPQAVHALLHHWSGLVQVPLEKLVYTSFRAVESDVGKKRKNLDDSARIAAVAGMSGGGW